MNLHPETWNLLELWTQETTYLASFSSITPASGESLSAALRGCGVGLGVGKQEYAPLCLALQDVIQGVHSLTCLLQWIIEDQSQVISSLYYIPAK